LPSTRFLFWNVNRKPLAEVIADLAESQRIDVLILAEAAFDAGLMLRTLNRGLAADFHFPLGLNGKIAIYTRFSREFLQPTFESERISIRKLALPARSEVLLAAVHFPSKLHWSNESFPYECGELARTIAKEEDRAGHRRTILVGDFNMNPFESGMVAAGGLHAMMTRRIAGRIARTVQGREYRMFYNPMWGHFGDAKSDTAGSYYYDHAEPLNYFWNMFDQVLIRPELADRFDSEKLQIVTSVGERSLVRSDGRPDSTGFSDHLPIVFELEF
jgi:exonuclease III